MQPTTHFGLQSHRSLAPAAVLAFLISSALPAAPLAAQDDARAAVSVVLDARNCPDTGGVGGLLTCLELGGG